MYTYLCILQASIKDPTKVAGARRPKPLSRSVRPSIRAPRLPTGTVDQKDAMVLGVTGSPLLRRKRTRSTSSSRSIRCGLLSSSDRKSRIAWTSDRSTGRPFRIKAPMMARLFPSSLMLSCCRVLRTAASSEPGRPEIDRLRGGPRSCTRASTTWRGRSVRRLSATSVCPIKRMAQRPVESSSTTWACILWPSLSLLRSASR